MKNSHIFGIVIIAVAIVILISSVGDASTYVSFKEASALAVDGNSKSIHVVGKLPKDEAGRIMGIKESPNKKSFYFQLVDNNNKQEKVFYNNPVPPDFDRSEQIVIVGKYKENGFVADRLIMKCPSKYQENKLSVK